MQSAETNGEGFTLRENGTAGSTIALIALREAFERQLDDLCWLPWEILMKEAPMENAYVEKVQKVKRAYLDLLVWIEHSL